MANDRMNGISNKEVGGEYLNCKSTIANSFCNSSDKTNLPKGWQVRSIDSLCLRVTSGGTPLRNNPAFYKNGTIPWVKTKELKDWYIDDSEEKITPVALEKSSAKLFPPNTVLMAMYGDGRTITSLGILRIKAATNQACCALIVNPDVCGYLYLFYALKYHRNDFIHLASGGAQRNLSGLLIRNFAIKVPPLETQRRIIEVLSFYDDLIENNMRRIKILEEMAQALYREWFVKFLFPGHEKVKMVKSELGMVPEGWEVKEMREVADVIDCLHSKKPLEFKGGTKTLLQLFNIADCGKLDLSKRFFVSDEDYLLWTSRIVASCGDCVVTNVGRIAEEQEVKKVAQELLVTLKKEKLVLDWRKRQQSRAAVRLAIEENLDRLPRSFVPDLYWHKCDVVYQHIYDSYFGQGLSIYAHSQP